MISRRALSILVLAIAAGILAMPADARIWRILPDGSGDAPTIEAGVDSAQAGDVVEIGAGYYSEHDIAIGDPITIRGATGDPEDVVIHVGWNRAFEAWNVDGLTFEFLTIQEGNATYGAGLLLQSSNTVVRDCVFRDGYALGDGAITASNSDIEITRCRFERNETFDEGAGAVWLRDCSATVSDCVFADNLAWAVGAGMWLFEGQIVVERCVFVGQTAGIGHSGYPHGSAIYVTSSTPGAHRIVNCTFVDNHGESVIYSHDGSWFSLENSLVAFNEGIPVATGTQGGTPAVTCTDIFGNAAGDWVDPLDPLFGQDGNVAVDPLFCDAFTRDFSLAAASPCLPEANPECGLIGARPQGCDTPLSAPAVVIARSALHPAAPNPFNPRTTIAFDLARAGETSLVIHDLRGRLLATLVDGACEAGYHEAVWTGCDDHGRALPSGIYLCRLSAPGIEATRRMALIR